MIKDVFAVIGALSAGATFVVILLVILGLLQERDDRRAREREQLDAETTAHIRRFSAALAVIDLNEYRTRKANASSASHVASEASRGRLESQPGAETILPLEAQHNA